MSDLISRQAAIDALCKRCDIVHDDDVPCTEECNDIKILRKLPSTEPKTGEWIDAEIPLESGGAMPIQVCNLCNTFYPLAYTGGGHNFCPNCGADMRGEQND